MSIIRKQTHNNATPKIVGGLALTAIVVIAGVAIYNTVTQQNSIAETPVQNVTISGPNIIQPDPTPVQLPAGTGTATLSDVEYSVPRNHVGFMDIRLEFEQEVITDVSIDHSYDPVSEDHVAAFDSEIRTRVVGRTLDGVDDSLIGSASLTSNAFFTAIRGINIDELDQTETPQIQTQEQ